MASGRCGVSSNITSFDDAIPSETAKRLPLMLEVFVAKRKIIGAAPEGDDVFDFWQMAPEDRTCMIALITGITGQDGSYLTEALLQRGDVVHGTVRRTSTLERSRLAHLYANPAIYNKQLFLHYAELEDITTLRRITDRVKPQQFYHLAGQSHVGLSFEMPETTCQLTAIGTLKILEVLRDTANPPRFSMLARVKFSAVRRDLRKPRRLPCAR
jgi:GDP-mannose 4,6 dehydratase